MLLELNPCLSLTWQKTTSVLVDWLVCLEEASSDCWNQRREGLYKKYNLQKWITSHKNAGPEDQLYAFYKICNIFKHAENDFKKPKYNHESIKNRHFTTLKMCKMVFKSWFSLCCSTVALLWLGFCILWQFGEKKKKLSWIEHTC